MIAPNAVIQNLTGNENVRNESVRNENVGNGRRNNTRLENRLEHILSNRRERAQ